MRKLGVGLVGATGSVSRIRGRAFRANPEVEVLAACVRDPGRRAAVAAEYGCRVTGNWRELLEDEAVDAVGVAVPNTLHFEIARAALEKGKHVLVEYPMAQDLAGHDELVSLARKRGVVLHHGLNCVLESRHRALMRRLPEIGRPVSSYDCYHAGGAGWYGRPELAGDPFLALHIHFIAYQLARHGPAASVYAASTRPGQGALRVATVTLGFASGAVGVVEFAAGAPRGRAPLVNRVAGETGCLEVRAGEGGEKLHAATGEKPDRYVEEIPRDTSLEEETGAFVDFALRGKAMAVSLDEAREVSRICLLASRSAREGRALEA